MNTPELLEQAADALARAEAELQLVYLLEPAELERRAAKRDATVNAIRRVLDTMRATLTAIPVVAALVLGAGQAKAADQTAAIAKAEQKVELATCQLNFLQQRPGAKKNDREYFGFMFQCLSK